MVRVIRQFLAASCAWTSVVVRPFVGAHGDAVGRGIVGDGDIDRAVDAPYGYERRPRRRRRWRPLLPRGGTTRSGSRGGFRKRWAAVATGAVGAHAEDCDTDGMWRGVSADAVLGATRPVPATGRFRAGSITKTFAATVALQLVDEGRLRLDGTCEKRLPGVVVRDGHRITLRQLLNHASGCTTTGERCRCGPGRSSWPTDGGRPCCRPGVRRGPPPTRRRRS